MIDAIAFNVSNDEPSFLLREYDADKPGHGSHRFQELKVVRDDRIATYKEVLGRSDLFAGAKAINIIGGDPVSGGVYETVGSLRDMANEMRLRGFSDDAYDVSPTGTPEQWAEAYHDERAKREARKRKN